MPRTTPSLIPRLRRLLSGLGTSIRHARLRRRHSVETVAERAGISRKTLYRVERGDPAVAIGIYARVLQALRLENDLAAIAVDDVLGRKLQDADLEARKRAPRKAKSDALPTTAAQAGAAPPAKAHPARTRQ